MKIDDMVVDDESDALVIEGVRVDGHMLGLLFIAGHGYLEVDKLRESNQMICQAVCATATLPHKPLQPHWSASWPRGDRTWTEKQLYQVKIKLGNRVLRAGYYDPELRGIGSYFAQRGKKFMPAQYAIDFENGVVLFSAASGILGSRFNIRVSYTYDPEKEF